MVNEDPFASIQKKIAEGKLETAVAETVNLANSNSDDKGVLLRCASVLKAIENAEAFDGIVEMVVSLSPEDDAEKVDIGLAFVGLGLFDEACVFFDSVDASKIPPIPYARALIGCGRPDEALEILPDGIEEATVLKVEALCALGRHEEAFDICMPLLDGGWEIKKAYCGALMHSGDNKGALKYVRKTPKDSKGADYNALAAFVMRVNGRTAAAAGYAGRALKEDPHHVGALEEMAMCLIEKGELGKARFFAGAINEVSPGNPATIRILDACSE